MDRTQTALSARPRLTGVGQVIFHDPDPARAEQSAYVIRRSAMEVRAASTDAELIALVQAQIPDVIVTTGTTPGDLAPSPLSFQIELARRALFIPTLGVGPAPLQFADLIRLAKNLQNISRDELTRSVLTQWTQACSLGEGELGRLMLYRADAGWGILSVLGRKDPLYFREALQAPNPGELFRIGKVVPTVSGDCATDLGRLRETIVRDPEVIGHRAA